MMFWMFWSQATGGQQLFCDTELVVKPISQWLLKNVRVRRFYVSLWEKLDHMVVQEHRCQFISFQHVRSNGKKE